MCNKKGDCLILPTAMNKVNESLYKESAKNFTVKEPTLTLIYKEEAETVFGKGKTVEPVLYFGSHEPTYKRVKETRRHHKLTTTDSEAVVFCDQPDNGEQDKMITVCDKLAIVGESKMSAF